MSWFNARIAARLAAVALLGALTAGCFQPMYAEHTPNGGPGLRQKLQDNAAQPRYIETEPGIGYRFIPLIDKGM